MSKKRYPKDWLCSCGKRHTGLPLDLKIWPEESPQHQPVSVFEVRIANSRLAGTPRR